MTRATLLAALAVATEPHVDLVLTSLLDPPPLAGRVAVWHGDALAFESVSKGGAAAASPDRTRIALTVLAAIDEAADDFHAERERAAADAEAAALAIAAARPAGGRAVAGPAHGLVRPDRVRLCAGCSLVFDLFL